MENKKHKHTKTPTVLHNISQEIHVLFPTVDASVKRVTQPVDTP